MDTVISKTKIQNAMDLTAAMASEEIARHYGWTESEALAALLSSKTGEYLYDDLTKFWWAGPSAIAELFEEEYTRAEGKPDAEEAHDQDASAP